MLVRGIGFGALSMALLIAAVGCGAGDDDGVPREALSGKVTFKGAPLDKASIQFMPEDANAGSGTSAEIREGGFQVPKERGLPPGGYKVMISSIMADAVSGTEAPGAPSKPKADPIPKKYNVATTLNAEVKAGDSNEFTFDLDAK